MKKKDSKNYLDFVPEKNPEIEYEADEDGIITVLIEWKGFYHKIAQKLFRRPRVSDIRLDELGSFVWNAVDGKKDVHQISKELEQQFPKMEKPVPRLIKYYTIIISSTGKEKNINNGNDPEIPSLCSSFCSGNDDRLWLGTLAYFTTESGPRQYAQCQRNLRSEKSSEKKRSFNQKRVRTFCKRSYCKAAFYAGFHRSH